MDRLLEGYRRFRAEVWPAEHDRYRDLAESGQRPETLVIACSDSRVDPQTVFGAAPGEMFVIRNIAGLVPPYQPDARYHGTSAALEYGVRVLGVSRVVVLAHGQCGGIQTMIDGGPNEALDFVESWLAIAQPVMRRPPANLRPGELAAHYEKEVLRLSVDNLGTFPWIASAVAAGRLSIAAFRFAIYTGVLERLEGDRLVPVAGASPAP